MSTEDAVTALMRFGLGPRAGDVGRIAADPRGALRAEIAERDVALLKGEKLPDSAAVLGMYRDFQQAKKAERAAEAATGAADNAMMAGRPEMEEEVKEDAAGKPVRNYTLRNELPARIARLREAQIGLGERLVSFWLNHFAVETDKNAQLRSLAGPYEREAIRPHVLGKFEDMLVAATTHPAMLLYLDNAESVGPNSKAGERREEGLNENHARELMELHTLSVDGGYTQADVTALAHILTGWSVGRGDGEDFGRFTFRARAHEPGAQEVLGKGFAQKGERQGRAALTLLAKHPATARHIARKLVRYFVADEPPAELVAKLSAVFTDTGGDLQAVTLALVDDDAAWAAPASKLRTPQEFVAAALRALDVKIKPNELAQVLTTLGQPLMNPPSPAGFADDTATWLAPDAMTNRLDVAELLAAQAVDIDPRRLAEDVLGPRLRPPTAVAIAGSESPLQGLALLLMSPEFQRR